MSMIHRLTRLFAKGDPTEHLTPAPALAAGRRAEASTRLPSPPAAHARPSNPVFSALLDELASAQPRGVIEVPPQAQAHAEESTLDDRAAVAVAEPEEFEPGVQAQAGPEVGEHESEGETAEFDPSAIFEPAPSTATATADIARELAAGACEPLRMGAGAAPIGFDALPSTIGAGHATVEPVMAAAREHQRFDAETLSMLRTLTHHADHQRDRSERALALAERLPAAMEALAQLRASSAELVQAVKLLDQHTLQHAERADLAATRASQHLSANTGTIDKLDATLAQANQTQQQTAGSLAELALALTGMRNTTEAMRQSVEQARADARQREEHLAALVRSNRRWAIASLVIACVAVVAALTLAIVLR